MIIFFYSSQLHSLVLQATLQSKEEEARCCWKEERRWIRYAKLLCYKREWTTLWWLLLFLNLTLTFRLDYEVVYPKINTVTKDLMPNMLLWTYFELISDFCMLTFTNKLHKMNSSLSIRNAASVLCNKWLACDGFWKLTFKSEFTSFIVNFKAFFSKF